MLALRLTRVAHPAVHLRRLTVAAASAGTGFLLLCSLGHALGHPDAPGASLLRLSWCAVPLVATVYLAVAVARADPGTRPGAGLSALGLGPWRMMAVSAATTALSCALGCLAAALVFLHLRGTLGLTGLPYDGAAAGFLSARKPLPVPGTPTLLTVIPLAASVTVALALRPRESRTAAPRRDGRFATHGGSVRPRETAGTHSGLGTRLRGGRTGPSTPNQTPKGTPAPEHGRQKMPAPEPRPQGRPASEDSSGAKPDPAQGTPATHASRPGHEAASGRGHRPEAAPASAPTAGNQDEGTSASTAGQQPEGTPASAPTPGSQAGGAPASVDAPDHRPGETLTSAAAPGHRAPVPSASAPAPGQRTEEASTPGHRPGGTSTPGRQAAVSAASAVRRARVSAAVAAVGVGSPGGAGATVVFDGAEGEDEEADPLRPLPPRRPPSGLPWGVAVLAAGLAVEAYAGRSPAPAVRATALPGGLAADSAPVLVGWLLTAFGLALAGPGLTHLCGRLLQAVRPGALRLLAGRVLMAEAGRVGRPLGVVCAVASGAYAMTWLYEGGAPAFGPLTALGALVVTGCAVAALLTAAVEARQDRAATIAALVRLGAPATTLRACAALRAGALLALFVPLTLAIAHLAALPLAR
ncbi:hypothetical protein GCM10010508_58550 [Streptomyces naganishii JCM 4654]|uniref:Uncharacterized protein n=1 Tax=Streptomyces naganishii JCM 4654 TaxID=1306179 RepID=A0A918Y9Q6_9ACTN|nr:hypothetical protein [Streptomyces naganishii]GHD95126.1 hypothetical protein GCM10010508_58550 [Streptomyces naganishii JCM 4654]